MGRLDLRTDENHVAGSVQEQAASVPQQINGQGGAGTEAGHTPVACFKTGHGRYAFRNWSYDFCCPICARKGRFNLNFLGSQRNVICNGLKFSKVEVRSRDIIRTETEIRALLAKASGAV